MSQKPQISVPNPSDSEDFETFKAVMTLLHPWYVQGFIGFCPLSEKLETVKSGNLLWKRLSWSPLHEMFSCHGYILLFLKKNCEQN